MRTIPILGSSLVAVMLAQALAACSSDQGSDPSAPGVRGDTNGSASAPTNGGGSGASPGGGASGATASGLPCDVDAVLAKNCQSCHGASPTAGASSSLVTWNDLNAPSKSDPSRKEYELIGARTHDDKRPMPPPPNMRLSATDQATLDGFIAASAPKSTAVCGSVAPTGDGTEPLSCTPDLHFAPPSPWSMPQNQLDQYVCYGVDVPATAAKHIVAFSPKVDNKKIVHHMLLFRAPSTVSSTPTPCSAGGSLQWSLMFGWAPGGKNMYTPKEAGYPLDPNAPSHFVVQVHYNNALALAGQHDSTGLDMCTSAPRQYEADVVAFGTHSLSIPPNSTYQRTCSVTIPQAMAGRTFTAAMPHMHTLGTAIDTHLTPAGGGAKQDMGTIANWDFQNQAFLPIQVTAKAGDTITTHCAYKNTTSSVVQFGENTENEMCYSFTMYYPRITTPLFAWDTPALTSTCQ